MQLIFIECNFLPYAETKTLLTCYFLDTFGQLWLLFMFSWALFYSSTAQNTPKPNIQMLTLLPVSSCLLFYLGTSSSVHIYASTHLSASCLQKNHPFSFQICWAIILNDVAADSIIPSAVPSLSARLTLGLLVVLMACVSIFTFTYVWPSCPQHAKWDALKELRNRLWSQAKVIPNDPLWLRGSYLVHILLLHFYRGHLLCPQYVAPKVIAVNPVTRGWVCAFKQWGITQERQKESSSTPFTRLTGKKSEGRAKVGPRTSRDLRRPEWAGENRSGSCLRR